MCGTTREGKISTIALIKTDLFWYREYITKPIDLTSDRYALFNFSDPDLFSVDILYGAFTC